LALEIKKNVSVYILYFNLGRFVKEKKFKGNFNLSCVSWSLKKPMIGYLIFNTLTKLYNLGIRGNNNNSCGKKND